MALFGTLNVAGPANRGNQIQQMAQNAAQNVMRRQKLQALLQQSAAGAAAHGGGQGIPMRGSNAGHPVGVRGATMHPAINPDQLAAMARSAGQAGHMPDGSYGGVFGQGGGGYDFGGVPNAADHNQSPQLLGPSPFQSVPTGPPQAAGDPRPPVGAFVSNPSIPGGGYINDNAGPTNQAAAPVAGPNPATAVNTMQTADATQSASGGAVRGWVSLGNGLFYDPVNDIVRGGSAGVGNGLVGQDGKF